MPELGEIYKSPVEFYLGGVALTVAPPCLEVGGQIEDWMRAHPAEEGVKETRIWSEIVWRFLELRAEQQANVAHIMLKETNPDMTVPKLKRLVNLGNIRTLSDALALATKKATVELDLLTEDEKKTLDQAFADLERLYLRSAGKNLSLT